MNEVSLTVDDILRLNAKLKEVPMEQWPRLWLDLNDRIWPKELGEAPSGYDTEERVHPVVRFYLDTIKLRCGIKACLRYAHKVDFGVTDQQFDDWWDSRQSEPLHEKRAECTEYCAKDGTKNCNQPIVTVLMAFLFGFFGCLSALLVKFLLQLL